MVTADWIAIGTGALAAGTFVLAWVTVKTSAAARRHDDEKRAEDRARDDRLRQEALDQAERREQAERTARDDYEARQVLVTVEEKEYPSLGHDFNRRVTLSTPHAYPIKWVDGRLVVQSNNGLGIVPFGHTGDEPYIDELRIYYAFWAAVPETAPKASPLMRFVDWHGNLYYQYRHYTQRFSQNTDWHEAAQAIDQWIRTGPKPD
ncbi:MAG TPA: hypothetical protein VKA66_17635 [Mycobacterium sp.]|nr:hypothetical protein [Mycobacterium sp.]